MHPTLAGLGVPILFIAGEHDHITSPAMIREASSLIPGSRYEVITGAGHSCYFEAAAAWNRLALAFFSSADAASRRD